MPNRGTRLTSMRMVSSWSCASAPGDDDDDAKAPSRCARRPSVDSVKMRTRRERTVSDLNSMSGGTGTVGGTGTSSWQLVVSSWRAGNAPLVSATVCIGLPAIAIANSPFKVRSFGRDPRSSSISRSMRPNVAVWRLVNSPKIRRASAPRSRTSGTRR